MMNYRKLIIIVSFFLILFLYILGPILEEKRDSELDYLNKDIIRFHVRANSDRKEDQALKLLVRDRVLDLMDKRLAQVQSVEESREIMLASRADIEALSRQVIRDAGYDYDIDVGLSREIFPLKKYGNLVFPQGEYESLTIDIGRGQGQNWWCVMFPPLCFVDITHSVALEVDDDDGSLSEYIVDETQPLRLKSLVFDWLKSVFK